MTPWEVQLASSTILAIAEHMIAHYNAQDASATFELHLLSLSGQGKNAHNG